MNRPYQDDPVATANRNRGSGSTGPEQAVREKIKNTFIIIIGVIVVKIITADAEPPAN